MTPGALPVETWPRGGRDWILRAGSDVMGEDGWMALDGVGSRLLDVRYLGTYLYD